ncbi:hypothetical protein J132_03107 [Termitomyces sp. J132]|nr:hypothetical protein J132_03107 [Termitomyces sp. J132]
MCSYTYFVLAATDHLRKKTVALEARIRSLEDAIAIVQANTSEDPHPLLNYLDQGDEGEVEEPAPKPVTEQSDPSAPSLGSLHVDGKGAARFFGPSGGSEVCESQSAHELEERLMSKTIRSLPELDDAHLPQEIIICYRSFPFEPPGIIPSNVQTIIEAFLPPVEHATYLCETFMEHLTWMFQIVTRRQVIKELIPAIYKQTRVSYGPHDLALLLIVLGIGTLVDLNLPPYSLEAQHYYRLSQSAVALQPVLREQSVVTIKVLHLMSIYNGMSGKESNLELSYALLDLASQVAVRVYIDPSLWGFSDKEAYDRRVYFWNLMAGVLWQSLVTGRPPSLLTTYIDCRLPTTAEEDLFQQDEVPLGFGRWGFQVSVDCLIPLVKTTLAVKSPPYQAILKLDQEIRATVKVHEIDISSTSDDRTATSMAVYVRSHYQALLLMFLHRGFFAQAMSDSALDLSQSPHGESVFTAYSSACVILADTKSQYYKRPNLISRIWRVWSLAFSAAVIVGTVAIRGIHLNLEPPAFEEFESACMMFQGAADTSNRAARAMPILQLMLEKAFHAKERYRQRQPPVVHETRPDDELSIFGGRTRLVASQSTTSTLSNSGLDVNLFTSSSADEALDSQVQDHTRYRSDPRNENVTFADLSGGWDGLFHGAPQPNSRHLPGNSSSPYPILESGDGTMLDDRWSSFMHNYNILREPTQHHSAI